MTLKLSKLPDRTPVKLTIVLDPATHAALADYKALYEREYGQTEPVEELASSMVKQFLAADKGFKKARTQLAGPDTSKTTRRPPSVNDT